MRHPVAASSGGPRRWRRAPVDPPLQPGTGKREYVRQLGAYPFDVAGVVLEAALSHTCHMDFVLRKPA